MSASIANFPEAHIVGPTCRHTHTVIFLHGRGSNGRELAESLADVKILNSDTETLFSHFPSMRWVFPTARSSFSTAFQEEITEWFDIYSLADPSEREELQLDGLRRSIVYLRRLMEAELDRVSGYASKLILAGISQGQAVAVIFLLLQEYNVGGFMGFSGWTPLAKHLSNPMPIAPRLVEILQLEPGGVVLDGAVRVPNTPVLLGHGVDDAYVDVNLGLQTLYILCRAGYSVLWKTYEGAESNGHWLKEPEEFEDIARFIETFVERPAS
ncbi:hypothetical protein DRE_02156 [Drechslerella stenobrocha 248]|uniref:Phospholipase/carboxylesterase/thioesterase domain-containing protein n=1 Tax=Drechslerella stenobrocha 248 TaxID=1043628 RepID=W7I8I7_9PEZI|nr:hypothetical protein DRE_02156 [Drechslerella stenobrocha 248]